MIRFNRTNKRGQISAHKSDILTHDWIEAANLAYLYKGSEKTNILPLPGILFTLMLPPWASINSFEIASPKPVLLACVAPGTLK